MLKLSLITGIALEANVNQAELSILVLLASAVLLLFLLTCYRDPGFVI